MLAALLFLASGARLRTAFAGPAFGTLLCCFLLRPATAAIQVTADMQPPPVTSVITNAPQMFQVKGFTLKGSPTLTTNNFADMLLRFTGTNRSIAELVDAAAALQHEYKQVGLTNVSVMLFRKQITNGVVQLNVFRAATPYILIDGVRCSPAPVRPANDNLADANRKPSPGTATNASPGFLVRAYEISGDTLLSEKTLTEILGKYTGTNVTVSDIGKAGNDLQMEYHNRGYPIVKVIIPPQKIDSNAIVKIRVFQGRLSEINVGGNRYFSSNNVMRALPSLHTNMILVGPLFQSEQDRANANQDRQIYAEIGPGPTEGTTTLDLKVKDRLPLHAKTEFDNQNSPGTPVLRLNTSMVYNNLWQREHSIGLQYSFSPEDYKTHNPYWLLDEPLVANYSGFYRMPLGTPSPVPTDGLGTPGSFGYDEGTRQFRLPPSSGQPELNFYASRSTIDTGLQTLLEQVLYDVPGVRTVTRTDVQQDLTIANDVGLRLSAPLTGTSPFRSTVSGGTDYKSYSLTSLKTNVFTFTEITYNDNGTPNPPIISTVASPVPPTHLMLDYVPVALRYDTSLRDRWGSTAFGLGLSVNAWFSGSLSNVQTITGSTESSGHWVIFTPSLSRDFIFHTNWVLSLTASGQWADEPVISNEQFGIGGVNNVRGYHEGEVFGNSGWWVTAEQRTPSAVIGRVYGTSLLSVRASVYTGYGQAFAVHPSYPQDLWGAGFGGAASIGPNWEARFLFSWPLIRTTFTTPGQPRFDFSLSAQF